MLPRNDSLKQSVDLGLIGCTWTHGKKLGNCLCESFKQTRSRSDSGMSSLIEFEQTRTE